MDSSGQSTCQTLPAACGTTPSCDCIPLTFPTCDSCMQSAAGDLEILAALDCF